MIVIKNHSNFGMVNSCYFFSSSDRGSVLFEESVLFVFSSFFFLMVRATLSGKVKNHQATLAKMMPISMINANVMIASGENILNNGHPMVVITT